MNTLHACFLILKTDVFQIEIFNSIEDGLFFDSSSLLVDMFSA